MDTILRIDLEPHSLLLSLIRYILIDSRRAKSLLHALKPRPFLLCMLIPVLDLEMHGLVFLVVGACAGHAGEDVEAEDTVGFGVFDLLLGRGGLGRGVVGVAVFESPGLAAFEDVGGEAGVHEAAEEVEGGVERGAHVADFLELFVNGGVFDGLLVFGKVDGFVGFGFNALVDGFEGGLGGEHARAHRAVGALYFGDVEEAGGVADETAAGEREGGD